MQSPRSLCTHSPYQHFLYKFLANKTSKSSNLKTHTEQVELVKTKLFSNHITFWKMHITAVYFDTMLIAGTHSAIQLGKFQTLQCFWAETWKAK
jgi:hypothetical protein